MGLPHGARTRAVGADHALDLRPRRAGRRVHRHDEPRQQPLLLRDDRGLQSLRHRRHLGDDRRRGRARSPSSSGSAFNAVLDGRSYPIESEGFFRTGTKPVLRLRTREGHSLRLTADHRVRRVARRTRAGPRDRVGAGSGPRRRATRSCCNDHRALGGWEGTGTGAEGYLLGLLIGDGTLKRDGAVLSVWAPEFKAVGGGRRLRRDGRRRHRGGRRGSCGNARAPRGLPRLPPRRRPRRDPAQVRGIGPAGRIVGTAPRCQDDHRRSRAGWVGVLGGPAARALRRRRLGPGQRSRRASAFASRKATPACSKPCSGCCCASASRRRSIATAIRRGSRRCRTAAAEHEHYAARGPRTNS